MPTAVPRRGVGRWRKRGIELRGTPVANDCHASTRGQASSGCGGRWRARGRGFTPTMLRVVAENRREDMVVCPVSRLFVVYYFLYFFFFMNLVDMLPLYANR